MSCATCDDVDGDLFFAGCDGLDPSGVAVPTQFAPETRLFDDREDCDDGNQWINGSRVDNPLNGVDEDCDGVWDCYTDADGDGFGVDTPLGSDDPDCEDAGESIDITDCNDEDAEIFPGAVEIAGNGIDENCDDIDDVEIEEITDGEKWIEGGCGCAGGARGGWASLAFLMLLARRRR